MISTEGKPVWQHLRHEGGGTVVIHAKDCDGFTLPIDEVVHACQSPERIDEFCRQVATLLDRLAKWLADRQSEVHAAYLELEPEGAIFLVVRKAKAFDPAFEDALSMLDLEIARDENLDMIRLRVLALPCSSEDTVASFLRIERSFRYVVGRTE